MPKPQSFVGDTPQFIAPFEVVTHDKPDDCWVSFLGKVYDITELVHEFENQPSVKPLLAFAGKDISHWFDERDGDICHYVHPVTGVRVPYCPHGPIPHVNTQVPSTDWRPVETPWWKDDAKYKVGLLTKRVRPLRITNTLIMKEVSLNVCCEDSLKRIWERYSIFNSDPECYTWRFEDRCLDPNKSLDENVIPDERDDFTKVGLPQSTYVPGLLLYYNDDLKWEDED